MFKIFVDDVREPPDSSWIIVRNYETARHLIFSFLTPGTPELDAISLDHDLGEEKTGYDLMKDLEHHFFLRHEKMTAGRAPFGQSCPEIFFHSANPVGLQNMIHCYHSIQRWLEKAKIV